MPQPQVSRPRRLFPRARPARHRFRPVVEAIEGRLLLSGTYTVTNTGDSGTGFANSGDLRYCINQANFYAGNLINFAPNVTGMIQLESGLPGLDQNLTVQSPGPSVLTVEGGGPSSDFSNFTVNAGVTATILGLTIAGGNASYGGGIDNDGNLTVTGSILSGDSAHLGGGGIYNDTGHLTVTGSTLSSDSAAFGGGLEVNGGPLTLSGSTISGDTGADGGGIFVSASGRVLVSDSTFSGDHAADSGGGLVCGGRT